MSQEAASQRKRPGVWLWLPLALFAGFFVLVMVGLLRPADREVAADLGDGAPGDEHGPGLGSDALGVHAASLVGRADIAALLRRPRACA